MRVAVVVFPGSNCEHDAVHALSCLGAAAELVWHHQRSLDGFDAVVIPGGFAHGDYLRPGAIARFSPVMDAVCAAAREGLPVLGICNGFQVLTEAHLLPGALQPNVARRFICDNVPCEVVSTSSALTGLARSGERLTLPINHYEGNYTCSPETLRLLEEGDRIPLRYVTNPNGSMGSVAAVANTEGNVVGLMPHPERACDLLSGLTDGRVLLESFVDATKRRATSSGHAALVSSGCQHGAEPVHLTA
ncbi:MAG: phosphoribosylformylglycinamidine synthase subunit PurQ [Acidimicrobiales bacterium]